MEDESVHRHDISDKFWSKLEPLLPGREGSWGGRAQDNRRFIKAVFWILRTGAPWRDLPASYGDWKNTHRRFCRWRDKGIWEKLMEQLIGEHEMEWIISTRATSKRMLTPAGHGVEIRESLGQKGAQHQDTSGRGCARCAGPMRCYGRCHG